MPDCRLRFYQREEQVHAAVEPMKPVINILQKELGDTVPPITDRFFVWLCNFSLDEDNLLEERKLSFKDTVRNEKPTLGSVQSAIDLFHQSFQAETKFQNLVSVLQNDDELELNHSKLIAETIHLLARRSETELLEKLEREMLTGFISLQMTTKST